MDDVDSCTRWPRASESDLEELTAKARGDLEGLHDVRLFITGGTGYIGRWLLESIRYANRCLGIAIQAVVLSRNPKRFADRYPHLANDPAIALLHGDVRDFSCVKGEFSYLIHAATDVVASNTPLETFDVTVLGTRRVLEFARDHAVRNVLLMSSGAVYGRFPDNVDRVPESYRGAPDVTSVGAAYGLGKIATEWLGNAYAQQFGFACKSARIFAQVGPYLELGIQFAAGNFIRDALLGRPIVIKGDGTALRSYMYATDLITWLLAILVRGRAGGAYNVGSDQAISIRELAQTIARIAKADNLDIKVLGLPAPGAAPDRYVPDTTAAEIELGLSITVPLEDALGRTIEWYRPQIQRQQT